MFGYFIYYNYNYNNNNNNYYIYIYIYIFVFFWGGGLVRSRWGLATRGGPVVAAHLRRLHARVQGWRRPRNGGALLGPRA